VRVRPIVVTALVVAALLEGCGAGKRQDPEATTYVTAVRAAQTRFVTSVSRIDHQAAGKSATVATVDRLSGAVDRMADDLRRIVAPDRVDRLHARLVGEVDVFRRALDRAGRAFRSHDRSAILAQRSRLQASARRATRDIEATLKGIDRTLRS
jgi:hypothetical protein